MGSFAIIASVRTGLALILAAVAAFLAIGLASAAAGSAVPACARPLPACSRAVANTARLMRATSTAAPSSGAAPVAGSITLHVSSVVVPVLTGFGGTHLRVPAVVLSGRVHAASPVHGLSIEIVVVPPAFPTDQIILRATTSASGAFRVSFHPHLNVLLQAKVAPGQTISATSHVKSILVLPKLAIGTTRVYQYPHHPPQITLILSFYWPGSFQAVGHPAAHPVSLIDQGSAHRAWFYGGTHTKGRFRRLGSGRIEQANIGCGGGDLCETEVDLTANVTQSFRSIRYILGCTKGTIARGVGIPDPSCGADHLRVR